MTGRIVRSADFERILRAGPKARSEHFAVHHLLSWPGVSARPSSPSSQASSTKLSTDQAPKRVESVDDLSSPAPGPAPEQGRLWLGAVVPKRHARRSVTRTQLKRQIRAAFLRHGLQLAGGLWVVRLRAPFDHKVFVSAASPALGLAARLELETMLRQLHQSPAVP